VGFRSAWTPFRSAIVNIDRIAEVQTRFAGGYPWCCAAETT
jgi:hypothetical protein